MRRELKLPVALEQALAFKSERAKQIGVDPEDIVSVGECINIVIRIFIEIFLFYFSFYIIGHNTTIFNIHMILSSINSLYYAEVKTLLQHSIHYSRNKNITPTPELCYKGCQMFNFFSWIYNNNKIMFL